MRRQSFPDRRPSKAADRAAAVQLVYNAKEIPSVDLLVQRYRLTRPDAQDIIAKAQVARAGR